MGAQGTLMGSLIGSGLMYMMDPVAGGRRRAYVRDKLVSLGRRAREAQDTTARDLHNRLYGLRARVSGAMSTDGAPDDVVEERARAALGPLLRYPRLVQVAVADSRLTLTGAVAADEVQRLVRRLESVRGVGAVDNRLEVHDDPATLPGVQPPILPRRPAPPVALLRHRWPPAVRLLAGAAGAALFLRGAGHRSPAGLALMLLGGGALVRSVTNEPLFGDHRAPRPTRTRDEDDRARAGGSWSAD
jgi:hypothetical protein